MGSFTVNLKCNLLVIIQLLQGNKHRIFRSQNLIILFSKLDDMAVIKVAMVMTVHQPYSIFSIMRVQPSFYWASEVYDSLNIQPIRIMTYSTLQHSNKTQDVYDIWKRVGLKIPNILIQWFKIVPFLIFARFPTSNLYFLTNHGSTANRISRVSQMESIEWLIRSLVFNYMLSYLWYTRLTQTKSSCYILGIKAHHIVRLGMFDQAWQPLPLLSVKSLDKNSWS